MDQKEVNVCDRTISKAFQNKNKTGFLQNRSLVYTTVWLHHLNFFKTLGDEARRELLNDTVYFFQQIQRVAPHKTTTERSQIIPVSPTRYAVQCVRNKEEQISAVFLWNSARCGYWEQSKGLSKCNGRYKILKKNTSFRSSIVEIKQKKSQYWLRKIILSVTDNLK